MNNRIDGLNVPLTIEGQLENYTKREGHTDRNEALWHAWCQNKRWLSQILQITLHSFPTYSRHDESHALSVLNNIEMLLGQQRISELSATDCFVLLHTVYIHDIGMCITKKDRKEIIENVEFVRMLDRLEMEGDETVKRAIESLRRTDYRCDDVKNYYEREKELYRAKLEVYYAIIELIADFRRSEHGDKSAERLYNWTMEPDKLGAGFSMAGVPLRIFLAIARCAQMHTCGEFGEIKNLPKKDGGYASDYYHPRFISVLLMLGDILDMDNDRFHPMVFEFVEDFPETSQNHYDKHRAIRRLHISPEKIEIEADCQSQNALRLVRKECDMLAEILQNAGYMWSDICPEGFRGSLPVLGEAELYLNGQKIPEELVTAQFNISQKKAFAILEGSNLYEGRFVFLREFLQNAVDATKMQYWYDYTGMVSYYLDKENLEDRSPDKMNQEVELEKYPIEIFMKMQKKKPKGETSDITEEDVSRIKTGDYKGYEYGVLVTIKDFGTGIDKDSILAISQVGNSRHREWKVIGNMPKWLRPTAEFGVGLQSAFLLTQGFKCITNTRSGERYEITFNSGASSRYQGYINVIPRKTLEGKYQTYGTFFEIFVPLDKKFKHDESLCTWSGEDPFDEEYELNRPFRHAAELISQMALYLDRMLGEMLFPVVLKISRIPEAELALGTKKWNSIQKMTYCFEKEKWRDYYNKSWIFKKAEESPMFLFGEVQRITYGYEYDTCKLHLWNKEIDAFCAVSGSSLLEREEQYRKNRQQEVCRRGITIYYKGIELQCKCIEEDIEMFEYIDIKGELKRAHINISRRGFTPEGTKYFEKEIYAKLLYSVKIALKDINSRINKINKIKKKNEKQLHQNILTKIGKMSDIKSETDYKEQIRRLAQQLLTIAFLSFLTEKGIRDEMSRFGEECGSEEYCNWKGAIEDIACELNRAENGRLRKELGRFSKLFDIESYKYSGNKLTENHINILDIFSKSQHYGVLHIRDNEFGRWTSYLISLEEETYNLCEKAILGETQEIRKKKREQLEKCFNQIIELSQNIGESVGDAHKYEQQFLLTWLSKNLPLIGVGSSENGNVRFNIISNYILPAVYTNLNHKILIMERILETAKERGISRFSIYAWQDRQYLSVDNIPFSCYFVKRGYLNAASLHKVVVPFDKQLLNDIGKVLEKIEEHTFVKNIQLLVTTLNFKSYCSGLIKNYNENDSSMSGEEKKVAKTLKDMQNYNGQSSTSLIFDMNQELMEILEYFSEQENAKVDEDYYEKIKLETNRWRNLYLRYTKAYLGAIRGSEQAQNEIEEIRYDEDLKFLAKGWYMLKEHATDEKEIEKHSEIREMKKLYLQRCQNDLKLQQKNKRIIEFILENTRYSIQKDKLELCYKALIEELFDLYEEMEKRKLKTILKNLLGSIINNGR